jgi:hypothetical protein
MIGICAAKSARFLVIAARDKNSRAALPWMVVSRVGAIPSPEE